MKKTYTNIEGFWMNNLFVEAGSTLFLSEEESKYIRHNLVEVTDDVPEGVIVEGEETETEDKPARRTKK